MSPTITRDALVGYLDDYLNVSSIADKSPNGLQVQGCSKITKLAYAVDASVQTITAAVRSGANMLVVHHGLWWGQHEQIVGNMHRRISKLIGSELSLYAAHLPLDVHPDVGNNAELVRLLGLQKTGTFGNWMGLDVGLTARTDKPLPRNELLAIIESTLDTRAVLLPFGPDPVRHIGVISGDAARCAEEAKLKGCDTLLTGETSHSSYHTALEARINVIFAGHYATETVGLAALSRHLKEKLNIPGKFISAPTGF